MEQIYKMQPNRALALRGFNSFAAATALHSATASGFQVSGTFRDAADFAVLHLHDADNYYEHPSIKYLPDFDFSGLTLSFDLQYTDGVQPIDSPKYNWIDWATLDCILVDDRPASRPRIRLWDHASLSAGSFTPASATFTLAAGPDGPQPGDRLTLWFENLAFDYTLPPEDKTAQFQFYAAGTGTAHTIAVNGRVYEYTESKPAGESSADVAAGLIALLNAGAGDPDVAAASGSQSNAVKLTVLANAANGNVRLTASDGNGAAVLTSLSLSALAGTFRTIVNTANWAGSGHDLAVIADGSDADLHLQAARLGFATTTGRTVTWSPGPQNADGSYPWSDKFPGLNPGDPFWIGGMPFTIASVDAPTQVTLTALPGSDLNNAPYLAPRGGRDGNMITLYSTAQAGTPGAIPSLTTQLSLQLSGGRSDCTWNVQIDFSALGIDQLRQCWLTFAPALANGQALNDTDWLATFSNWSLSGDDSRRLLKIAGPGSVRIEENSGFCSYQGDGWLAPPGETGFYSRYAAAASRNAGDSVTVEYTCSDVHDLYLGTSLYTDRGTFTVQLDGAALDNLNCTLFAGSPVVTRRRLATGVPSGNHTVTLTNQGDGAVVYFDFLEAAIPSDWPNEPNRMFKKISPALDYDTDHTYKLSPARLMWIFDLLGFAGPINEYLGVFWWNQRTQHNAVFPQATVTFDGAWQPGDTIFLSISSTTVGKTVFPGDSSGTIAAHFAYFINAELTGAWASFDGSVLTLTARSPAQPYALAVSASTQLTGGSTGTATVGDPPAAGAYGPWIIDTSKQPVLNRSVMDWHSDLYAECATRGLEITTSASMELVLPPVGFVSRFPDPDHTRVATDTGFGALVSNHCAIGSSNMIAYQQQVFRAIAGLQTAAGLTPSVQFGEFLWWFFPGPDTANPAGMAYYDAETAGAAKDALNRPLHVFLTPDDDPSINGGADATFLRNRLRDHVAALAADLRSVYPDVRIEVLFPYDVNYPHPVQPGSSLGGRLNNSVNLPLEWKQKDGSGLDCMKVEALQFTTQFRSLDLARQAVQLMPGTGWPRDSVRYMVPVFGTFQPWQTESGLAFSEGLQAVNLWAFDHMCLLNLDFRNLREPS